MSIHIDEITIGMHVSSGLPQGTRSAGSPGGPGGKTDTDALVRECVQLVLQALTRERER